MRKPGWYKNGKKKKNNIVYYIIKDDGLWPDGCKFPRYTLLYVDSYIEDYNQYGKAWLSRIWGNII